MSRPSKLTSKVLDVIDRIINESILICTDEELVERINELMPESERFTYEAFSKWKRGLNLLENPNSKEFIRLIKKALVKEKERLLKLLETDDKQWQRFAWILERKFDEWNIKTKSEVNQNLNIRGDLPDIIIKNR